MPTIGSTNTSSNAFQGTPTIGTPPVVATQASMNIHTTDNDAFVVNVNGSSPERGYYNDEFAFKSFDELVTNLKSIFGVDSDPDTTPKAA